MTDPFEKLLRWSGPSDVCIALGDLWARGWQVDVELDLLFHVAKRLLIPGPTFRATLQATDPRYSCKPSNGLAAYLESLALSVPERPR